MQFKMGTPNICLCKEVGKKYTGCNLKATELLDWGLIGECTVIRSNTHLNLLLGWSGVAKESGILRHWGVQLILAYSWARPAILIADKGRGGMFLFLLFHSCSSFFPVPLFHLLYYLFSPISLGDDTK